jgi:DNA-directed RNA polymerase specialized sigma24 family protein
VYVKWRRIHDAPESYARKTLANLAANRWRSKGRKPEVTVAELHGRRQGRGEVEIGGKTEFVTLR